MIRPLEIFQFHSGELHKGSCSYLSSTTDEGHYIFPRLVAEEWIDCQSAPHTKNLSLIVPGI